MSDVFSSDQEAKENTEEKVEKVDNAFSMIGEDKKYKSVADADKALFHSQQHIEKIQSENAELARKVKEMEEQLLKAKTIDEVLNHLDNRVDDSGDAKPASDHAQPVHIKPEDVMSLVDKALKEKESKLQLENNLKAVNDTLIERFGDQAKDIVKQLQQEIGVDVKDLAMRSPKAALKLFDNVKVEKPVNSDVSTVNTGSLKPKQPESYQDDSAYKKAVATGNFKVAEAIALKHLSK